MIIRLARLGVLLLVAALLTACGGGDELVPTSGDGAVDPLATAAADAPDGDPAPTPVRSAPVAEAPPSSVLTPVAGFAAEQRVPGAGTVYSRTSGELPTLVLSYREDQAQPLDDDVLAGLLTQIPLDGLQVGPSEPVALAGLEGRVVTATANIASGEAADLRLYALVDANATWSMLLIAPAGDGGAMADLVTLAETFAPSAG